jgi:gamma-resorcylate decarboxylase
MQGKIGLEEHFAIADTLMDSARFFPDDHWPELRSRLIDRNERRLAEMGRHGMEMMILSLNAPAIQAVSDSARAVELARRANDALAEVVARKPDRFRGFAALPLQDSDESAHELGRCVRDLGFVGALVNGFSQVGDGRMPLYYDLKQFWRFWAEVERLGVPFYLHPRTRWRRMRESTMAIPGCSAHHGHLDRRRRCTHRG